MKYRVIKDNKIYFLNNEDDIICNANEIDADNYYLKIELIIDHDKIKYEALKKVSNEQISTLKIEKSQLNSKLVEKNQKLLESKNEIVKLRIENEKVLVNINKLKEEINNLNKIIIEKNKEYEKLENEYKKLKEIISKNKVFVIDNSNNFIILKKEKNNVGQLTEENENKVFIFDKNINFNILQKEENNGTMKRNEKDEKNNTQLTEENDNKKSEEAYMNTGDTDNDKNNRNNEKNEGEEENNESILFETPMEDPDYNNNINNKEIGENDNLNEKECEINMDESNSNNKKPENKEVKKEEQEQEENEKKEKEKEDKYKKEAEERNKNVNETIKQKSFEDKQLKLDLNNFNQDSQMYINKLQEMKKKCYDEMNKKYISIFQEKAKEIIIEDIQKDNKNIFDNYIQKMVDLQEKRQNDFNQMSHIIINNEKNCKEINLSMVKTTHHYGIKCEKCGQDPIIGFRYKCSMCKNYNLCENCEQKNFETKEHKHYFIQMRKSETKK
jgi:hypothetical protein